MAKPNKPLIAHELGHVITSYLYDTKATPSSMELKPDKSTAAHVDFLEADVPGVADHNIARFPDFSYMGGLFGELAWHGRFNVRGVRSDMDEFISSLRFLGKEGAYRRSRSKLFTELSWWFYADSDAWSYTGCMKRWLDCPSNRSGNFMHKSRVKTRLPETYRLYQKFLGHIDLGEFHTVVEEIHKDSATKTTIKKRALVKMGRRIIPDTVLHPEDI